MWGTESSPLPRWRYGGVGAGGRAPPSFRFCSSIFNSDLATLAWCMSCCQSHVMMMRIKVKHRSFGLHAHTCTHTQRKQEWAAETHKILNLATPLKQPNTESFQFHLIFYFIKYTFLALWNSNWEIWKCQVSKRVFVFSPHCICTNWQTAKKKKSTDGKYAGQAGPTVAASGTLWCLLHLLWQLLFFSQVVAHRRTTSPDSPLLPR